ncbi:DUF4403 family protein [Aurantiacibacter sp. MUD11]|uniref:DUF4403 family protein n=1 Tax=Aurantiacibacter sp. MUD11 TaxID=3003265 RepID=UPI0022AB1EEF|nr:DUF4403 family protein [Aurantiacibacter sp. MUD11]WAT17286.1 DUF4403 family protein [Aurantiacibacter sp. MUD11]
MKGQQTAILLAAMLAALLVAGCSREIETEAPPRVEGAPDTSHVTSTLTIPVAVSLDQLQSTLERRTPRRLWQMNDRRANCIPAQTVRPLGIDLELTPDVPCTIIGEVNRGAILLSGRGDRLTIGFPTNATIRAQDIGDILAGETARGAADVAITARLSVTNDWRLNADVDLDYSWSQQPGIDFLGQRIAFTRMADANLRDVVAGIERELEQEISGIALRPLAEEAWRAGFRVEALKDADPPVWLRTTPLRLGVAGYRVEGRNLVVDIALEAVAETRIGQRPPTPEPNPLPAPARALQDAGIAIEVPVTVEYAQLEAVVLRELRELVADGVDLPGIGLVDAEIEGVEIYATSQGRLALGVTATANGRGAISARYGTARGQVWLTGKPHNAENSAVLAIRDLHLAGDTDRRTVDLLLALFGNEQVQAAIGSALVRDFGEEYAAIIEDARQAVSTVNGDGLSLSLVIEDVRHGRVQAMGEGLFLPVALSGHGRLAIDLENAGL